VELKYKRNELVKTMMLHRLTLSMTILSLSACVSSLTPSPLPLLPHVGLPTQWSTSLESPGKGAAQHATDLAQWWQRFNDPLLNVFIRQALQANTEVGVAKALLRQSRALHDVASAAMLPRVDASASAQRSRSGDASAGNSFHAGFDAAWEPDIFGGKRNAVLSSEANLQASAASLADIQISIAAEVALTYIQYRGTQARLAIAQDNLASQLETLQLTQWRVQAGILTSLEAEQARAASEQTKAQIPALETNKVQTEHALALLCGQTPDRLHSQLNSLQPVPQADDELTISIPAETLRQRPDVLAAEHQLSAAWARVKQADATLYPDFQISGSVGWRALTIGLLSNSTSFLASILGGVSMPVFDAGAGQAQVRAQQAVLEQARMSYRSTVLVALKEVEDALVALNGNRQRLLRSRSAFEAAANAALMARQRYNSGLVDFQTVLETQRSMLNTQDAVATIVTELSADHVRLYKALGGGWQADTQPSISKNQ
jgi:multidrug efflux system outer membrane protein